MHANVAQEYNNDICGIGLLESRGQFRMQKRG